MMSGRITEVIIAYGHPNITAKHKTTLMITKNADMGKDADCIIAVKADKDCCDLGKEFKTALFLGKVVKITIEADGIVDKVNAFGSPALKLNRRKDIVIRRSDFIDDRTLAIMADKASCDLNKDLAERLKNPENKVKITLLIE